MAVLGALGDLVLALSADTAKFQSDLGRADRVAKKFGREVGRALGNVAGMLVALGGSAGLTALVKNQIDAADAAGKLGQKIGISTEALSSYMVAARLADVSNEQLQTGLQQLSKNQAEFVAGTGEAKDAFAALGITTQQIKDLNGDTAAIFELVVGKLASFEDGANKTAIAMKIFGRSGAELIPLINGLEKTRTEAEMLGAIIDKDTAAAAERFNDNLTRVGIAVQAVGLNIAKAVLPTLEKLSERFVATAKDAQSLTGVAWLANTALKTLATGGAVIASIFEVVGDRIGAVFASISAALSGDLRGALEIQKQSFGNFLDEVGGAARSISKTWDDTANEVKAKAPDTGKKLAAPALVAADATKKAVDGMHAHAMRAFEELKNFEEAGVEAQKAMEKAFGETLDRDDADMVREVALLEDANEAIFDIEKATGAATKKAEGFNFTFDSALENVIVKGGEARDVVDALITDLSRMVTRELVTKPLGDFVSGALGSAGGISGIIGSMFGGTNFGLSSAFEGMPAFAEGTDFVPRTGLAMVHRGEKIVPAEENARGGRPLVINFNGVRDMDSFRRNEAQISGDLAMAVARARRNT